MDYDKIIELAMTAKEVESDLCHFRRMEQYDNRATFHAIQRRKTLSSLHQTLKNLTQQSET